MKYAIVIMGGAADQPADALGGQTPLQAVKAPMLKRMGDAGRLGQVRVMPDNVEPGADAAMMALLGYDPARRYTGKAPLTALGLGIDVPEGAWAMHLSLVSAPNGTLAAYDDQVLPPAEAQTIVQELLPRLDLPGAVVHPGVGAMHVLIDLGKDDDADGYRDWSPVIAAPPSVIVNQPLRDHLPVGDTPGERLQHLIAQSAVALEGHEINEARLEMNETLVTHLWPWGLGQTPRLRPWAERFGKTAVVISPDPSVRGLAQVAGLDAIEPLRGDDAEGSAVRMGADAVDAVSRYDLVIVHADAPALAGLDGNIADKVNAIRLIDEHVLKPVEHALAARGEHRLMATPLYATPADLRRDVAAPVPFVITGYKMAGVVPRAVTEPSASACDLKVPYGHELMEFFLKSGVRG
ncbi:MAG: hypothetical protein ACE37H_09375 [Phycisphaeraceae bacterium]